MITYLLQVSGCWLIFYLLYYCWLSRETFFHLNRWYLLSTLLLGLLIPLLPPMLASIGEIAPATVYIAAPLQLDNLTVEVRANAITEPTVDWASVVWWIYMIGVGVASIRLFSGLWHIGRMYQRADRIQIHGYTVALTNEDHPPFSFFRVIFKSKHRQMDDFAEKKITAHELAHVRGWHTMDVLLVEIVSIITWCSPIIYLYRRSIRIVHEYIADAAAVCRGEKKKYGHLLLRQSQSGLQVALANHFIHSQLKKRIVMMTRSRSRREAFVKYLSAIPVLIIALLFFSRPDANAQQTPKAPATDTEQTEQIALDWPADKMPYILINGQEASEDWKSTIRPDDIERIDVLKGEAAISRFGDRAINGALLIELKSSAATAFSKDPQPVFPGCEDLSGEEQQKCSQKALLTHVYQQIKYPADAMKKGIEGTVVLKYVVGADGKVRDLKILRGIGGGCNEEVLRVAGTLPDFIPAKKDGKAVAAEMVLPVKFKLEDDSADQAADTQEEDKGATVIALGANTPEELYKVVEEMPRFPGCEDIEASDERKACADKKMLEYVYDQIKYPEAARKNNVEGIVVVQFVIEQDGTVSNAKVVRDIGSQCGEEALRVVKLMQQEGIRWTPGKQKGKTVRVQYNLPVRFALGNKQEGQQTAKKQRSPDDLFMVVEEMPLFPGCADLRSFAEKKACADKNMLEYIYNNIQYPKAARENKVEGMVIVQFVIEQDGTVSNAKVVRDIGSQCGEEALRVVKLMQQEGIRWTPGKQNGKAVRVQFNLPVKFSLGEAQDKQETSPFMPKVEQTAEPLSLEQFRAVPNPSSGWVNLQFQAEPAPTTIRVLTTDGREVFRRDLPNFNGNFAEQIDLQHAPKGTLLVSVQQGEKIFTSRLVRQ